MSKSSMSEFVSRIKSMGLARPSHFFVNIGGSIGSTDRTKNIMMLCDAASLPGYNIMTYEIRQFGEISNMPTGITYPPVNMSFYVDNSMEVMQYFHQWGNQVFDRTSRYIGYYGDFVRDVQIYVLDMNGRVRYTVTLYEAFPDNIGDVQLSYAEQGIMKVDVKLTYKWWKAEPSLTGSNVIQLNNTIRNIGGPLNAISRLTSGGLSGFQTLFDGRVEGLGEVNGWFGRDVLSNPFEFTQQSDIVRFGDILSNDFRSTSSAAASALGSQTDPGSFGTLSRNLSSSFGNMSNFMGNFGSGIRALGNSITAVTGPVNQMSLAISSVGSTIAGIDSTLNAFGINTSLGSVASTMQQAAGGLAVVSSVAGIPDHMRAIGTQMGAAGAQINRAVESMRTLPNAAANATNSIAKVAQSFSRQGTNTNNLANFLRRF